MTVATETSRRSRSLRSRPLDLGLLAFFSVSILYAVAFSLPQSLGVPVSADSPWPPLRWLYGWAVGQEPAHLHAPAWLIGHALFDGFVQAPALVAVAYGIVVRPAWLRTVGLLYAGAATTNMLLYLHATLLGPHPPLNLAVYLPLNLPWLVAPVLLALRLTVWADGRRG